MEKGRGRGRGKGRGWSNGKGTTDDETPTGVHAQDDASSSGIAKSGSDAYAAEVEGEAAGAAQRGIDSGVGEASDDSEGVPRPAWITTDDWARLPHEKRLPMPWHRALGGMPRDWVRHAGAYGL